jgi:hypothetical protein
MNGRIFHSNKDSFDITSNNLISNQANLNEKNNNNNLENEFNKIEIKIISKYTRDIGTQTNFSRLYEIEEKLIKKNRIYQADLIRDKIFTFFNGMIFDWLTSTKNEKDCDLDIINFRFSKNNKECINDSMNKRLKELFLYPKKDLEEKLKQINNELLKYKLELEYKYIYNIFISNKDSIKENEEFLKNFVLLDEYIEQLKLNPKFEQNQEYITRLKKVALNYNEWKDKKVHLFKKK